LFSEKKYLLVLERVKNACKKAQRNPEDVKILAATKGRSIEEIRTATFPQTEIRLCGENYLQEAEKKIDALKETGLDWHFIGGLQSNKVKKTVELFDVIESLDRKKISEKINCAAREQGIKQKCLIEVNIGGEKQKHGVKLEELKEFAKVCTGFENINFTGLMCSAPFVDAEQTRPFFKKMQKLLNELKPFFGEEFKELSMGMSNDFEVAVEEGSTEIRLGRVMFETR